MYNPSDVGKKGTLFGLPYSLEDADLVIVPVSHDVTASYRDGTHAAPTRILDVSSQLDLSLPNFERPWEMKVVLDDGLKICEKNQVFREKAKEVITHLELGQAHPQSSGLVAEINGFCSEVHDQVEKRCTSWLSQGKRVAVLGGDHSSSLGLIRALRKKHAFGILQVDAHMDLRKSYEGLDYSHASIMYNALQVENVIALTQVGIRDYCEEEEQYAGASKTPIHVYYDEVMNDQRLSGKSWKDLAQEIVNTLPPDVYISLDVDGLDPSLCPNTGTPVPGGLKFNEVLYLLKEVVQSGRKIIGFDLCEVGDAECDANVGARLLYRLSVFLGSSHRLI